MTVILNLPSERIAALREGIARRDAETIGRILLESSLPIVNEIDDDDDTRDYFAQPLTMEEYDRELAEIDAEFAVIFGPDVPELSDYAVSREGIYEDHP